MFSTLRTRFGIPGVISVIALVFAMFGGAYAASNSSDGGKATASAKAKKGPRGPKGSKGDPGPAGPAGPAGAKGDKGDTGGAGGSGTNGTSATTIAFGGNEKGCQAGGVEVKSASAPVVVCNGKNGANGQTGFTETLPSGKTETGMWGGRTAGAQFMRIPISFALPVASATTLVYVANEETKVAEGCPGIVEGLPQADPGTLCVYQGDNVEAGVPTANKAEEEEEGGAGNGIKFAPPGVGPAGTVLSFNCAGAIGGCFASGAWAVTAE
jgi:hypothetical protein